MADDSRVMLARLRVSLEADLPVATDVRQWLLNGLDRFEYRGVPLERAFGFAVPGRPSVRTEGARNERDAFLFDAARAIRAQGHDIGEAARRLAEAVRRFETREWPRLRGQPVVHAKHDPVRDAVCLAFLTGVRVPNSARHLRRIIKAHEAMTKAWAC